MHTALLTQSRADRDEVRTLIRLARQARSTAEKMTGTQLDDKHEQLVGYRPSVDDPKISPAEHCATVAGAIYYESAPGYTSPPLADAVWAVMEIAIASGRPL